MTKHKCLDLVKENYLNVYLLAIVPILGVSTTLLNALSMALILSFVWFVSTFIVFALSKVIDLNSRRFSYFLVLALMVSVVDLLLPLVNLEFYQSLGIYLPLICCSCLIFETFDANLEKSAKVVLDDILYKIVTLIVIMAFIGAVREFFGLGELLGYKIVAYGIPKVLVLQTSAGAFFVLAFLAFVINWVRGEK
ncbi:MAG: Rnf-Nqr domain containing protein [Alphaproteobacteria bacterium]|nr:Rnf-Nqr domain containing protein [Alphaproteobacteria bacterium]